MRLVAVLLLACLPLLSCSGGADSVAGGSGTGAGNALTVTVRDTDGSNVAGARVELWPATQVPSPQGSPPVLTGTTGVNGRVSFAVDTGAWSVLVRHGSNAFRLFSRSGSEISDTLRPMSVLTGFVKSAAGGRVALPGMGRSTVCDSTGFFRLDSLPSGALDWIATGVGGTTVTGNSQLLPGQTTVRATNQESTLVDSLLREVTPGAGFDRKLLGDTGAFAMVMQLRRTDTVANAWFLEWTSGSGRGVRLGLTAPDTLLLELDSTTYMATGYPLRGDSSVVGLRWTGSGWEVWIDGKQAIKASMATGTDRKTWTNPMVGGRGVRKIDWLLVRKGLVTDTWFGQSIY